MKEIIMKNIWCQSETALLLFFGAKIDKETLKNWPKNEDRNDFATEVCKELLEEKTLKKLDNKLIDYAEKNNVSKTKFKNKN